MNAQLAGDLIKLLEIKKELLARLLEFVRRSALLLREDDMDAFDSEMDNCKEITAKVDELCITTNQLKEQVAGAQQDEIAELEGSIANILENIETARKECNDVAQQKLRTYGQQIKTLRRTKKGIDGYANQFVRRDAVFIDEKK